MAIRSYSPKGTGHSSVSSIISRDLYNWLTDICEEQEITMSAYIRKLLENAKQAE